jgi:hypothetical protein
VRSASLSTHIANVRSCEEDLGNRLVELGKEVVPEGDELALPNGRERLLAAEALAAVLEAHVTEADADRTRRHAHDLVPKRAKLGVAVAVSIIWRGGAGAGAAPRVGLGGLCGGRDGD